MDGQLYYVTACFIYFGILGLIFMIAGIAWGRRKRQKWVTAAGMAAAAGILWLGIRYAASGSDYLPTYWSDFEFFSRISRKRQDRSESSLYIKNFPFGRIFFGRGSRSSGLGF